MGRDGGLGAGYAPPTRAALALDARASRCQSLSTAPAVSPVGLFRSRRRSPDSAWASTPVGWCRAPTSNNVRSEREAEAQAFRRVACVPSGPGLSIMPTTRRGADGPMPDRDPRGARTSRPGRGFGRRQTPLATMDRGGASVTGARTLRPANAEVRLHRRVDPTDVDDPWRRRAHLSQATVVEARATDPARRTSWTIQREMARIAR